MFLKTEIGHTSYESFIEPLLEVVAVVVVDVVVVAVVDPTVIPNGFIVGMVKVPGRVTGGRVVCFSVGAGETVGYRVVNVMSKKIDYSVI